MNEQLFVGLVVVAVVQAVKEVAPGVSGAITTAVAAVVGGLCALVAVHIGFSAMTFAVGAGVGLAAAGAHTVASKIG